MAYNGWKNWETWNVSLWIDNEEGLYREKIRFIRSQFDGLEADAVEEFCRELFPKGTPDMDGAKGLRNVDWEEIADHWRDEA